VQTLPVVHLVQPLPPQSASVSVPFFTLSEHVGTWHLPPVQTALVQSALAPQVLPSPHLGQPPVPPQSTSVSLPFFAKSMQLGALQTPV
jgi:hypothetical protein